MKKLLALLVSVLLFTSGFSTVSAASVSQNSVKQIGIYVNGEKLELGVNPVVTKGRTLVPLRGVFEKFNADVKWYPISASIRISAPASEISMRIGSNRVYVNESLKKMDVTPVLINGVTMVPIRFVAETLNSEVEWDPRTGAVSINTSNIPPRTSRGDVERAYKVVIDAGHGGKEAGARYYGYNEKDLNLKISKILNEMLKAEGIKTYMTRSGDSTVSLHERAEYANGVDADLMVSVHNNAGNPNTTGSMTLYYPGGELNSKGNLSAKEFADIVQNQMVEVLGARNLGVIKRPNLAVLRVANMPAVIAEVGYMSNKSELARLADQEYRVRAAEALKNAVLEALKRI